MAVWAMSLFWTMLQVFRMTLMRPGSDENWRNERTVSGSDRLPVFIELDFGAALKE